MNFLSNLFSGIKSAAGNVIRTIGSGAQRAASISGLTGKPFGVPPLLGGNNTSFQEGQKTIQRNTALQNIRNASGPQTTLKAPNIQGPFTPIAFNIPAGPQNIRPITPSGPQSIPPTPPRSSFVDTTNIPTPDGGKAVTRPGVSGTPGVSTGITFGGSSGTPGISGGGGSANTGLLGGIGSNIGSNSLTADEETRRQQEANGLSRTIVPETPTTPINVPTVPGAIDAGSLEGFRKETAKLLSSPAGLSADDRKQVNKNIQLAIDAGLQQVENLKAQMGEIVSDTKGQEDFINQSDDPVGIRGKMDEVRRKIGLPAIESNIVDLQGKINATNEAYQAIFDDIKSNPDLPKGLARRRLSELQEDQKGILQGFVNQLEIATVQRGFANDQLDREFGIIKEENDTIRQRQQDKRTILNTIINSGALGAYSDAELGQFAGSGFTTEELMKLRDAAKSPDVELRTVGGVGLIQATTDPKTGKVTTKVLVSSPKDTTKVPSGADIKTLFTQFLGSPGATDLTIDQLKSQAVSAGINLEDPKNEALLDLAKDAAKKPDRGSGIFGRIRNFIGI